jgi:LysM repeat protein
MNGTALALRPPTPGRTRRQGQPLTVPNRRRATSCTLAPTTHPGRGSSARLRLTRRGRAVLVLLITLCLMGSALGLAAATAGPRRTDPLPASRPGGVVVVMPGDSLWQVARRVAPTADPRRVVDQLRRSNRLDGSVVIPGQVLRMPQ